MLLDLESELITRLETIPELAGVYGASEFTALATAGKTAPCAYVLYGGFTVLKASDDGESARVEERWMVVLAVKSAARTPGALPTRSACVPLVSAVLGKLMGWRPAANSYKVMMLDSAPRPESMPALLLFPLTFRIEHVVRAAPP